MYLDQNYGVVGKSFLTELFLIVLDGVQPEQYFVKNITKEVCICRLPFCYEFSSMNLLSNSPLYILVSTKKSVKVRYVFWVFDAARR